MDANCQSTGYHPLSLAPGFGERAAALQSQRRHSPGVEIRTIIVDDRKKERVAGSNRSKPLRLSDLSDPSDLRHCAVDVLRKIAKNEGLTVPRGSSREFIAALIAEAIPPSDSLEIENNAHVPEG